MTIGSTPGNGPGSIAVTVEAAVVAAPLAPVMVIVAVEVPPGKARGDVTSNRFGVAVAAKVLDSKGCRRPNRSARYSCRGPGSPRAGR